MSLPTTVHCQTAPTDTSEALTNKTKGKEGRDCVCPVCEDPILDAKGRRKGQDAIFCNGTCQTWLHRGCAGLSCRAFAACADSKVEVVCSTCQITVLDTTVAGMKKELIEVKEMLSAMCATTSRDEESSETDIHCTSMPKFYATVIASEAPSNLPKLNSSASTH